MDPQTAFFVQHEMNRFGQRVRSLQSKLAMTKTVRDVVRIKSESSALANPAIRSLVRSGSDLRSFEQACELRAEKIIESAIKELGTNKSEDDKAYMRRLVRFADDMLNPCRGHFPRLFHVAERGMEEQKHARAKSLIENASQNDSENGSRPKKGADLVALGYVFHNTSIQAARQIAEEGITAGSFSRKPIDFGQEVWLAVPIDRLPPFQEHDYGGARALEPSWDPVITYDYDEDMNSIESRSERVIDPAFIVLSNAKGKALSALPLDEALEGLRSASPRP